MSYINSWNYGADSDEDLLNLVKQTAVWIRQYEHVTEHGIFWDVLPGRENDPDGVLTATNSLYGGTAGIALFFLRLFRVTKEEEWLELAKKGIDYVAATSKGIDSYKNTGEGTLKGIPAGFMNGETGGAYVSYLLYETTKEEKYKQYAIKCADDLIAASKEDIDGIYWSGAYGILADGGVILFLIWLYEKTHIQKYIECATKAGKHIAAQSEEAKVGIRWLAMDSIAFGLGEKGYFPGFFYGTAGTAYILAKLYEHVKDNEFIAKAKEAARYINSIADETSDKKAALIRYNDPYKTKLHYLGVCQGPIGTSRLYYQLYKLTGEETYLEWIKKLTNGIIRAGAPEKHSAGYWHTYCYCCGAAGMIEHFISVYRLTKDHNYLVAATNSVNILIGDSVEEDGKRCWYTAWNRHEPNVVENWTGLYLGSAGNASAILEYYNYKNEQVNLGAYLEDPYNN